LTLTWQDIELNEDRALQRHTKKSEQRAVWLHHEALRLLTEHQAHALDPVRVFVSEIGTPCDYHAPFADAGPRRD
jgi:hypothetical protein